ncbi:MAG TPA: AAA family ATPase [Candidatus Limnocylindrales bacterium]|nr:AAA family ATPase [Candidatus Limnocylindrales bacterium]
MYAHFYHLSENPFNLTPDPKFHYINESTREALASMMYGIKSRKGFLTLIGEAGTGKTTLLRRIVDEIEGETRIVFVFNPGVSFDELLEYICMELGIHTESRGRLHLLERLNKFLLEQLTEGVNVVVIIDEAQTLEDAVLEELRLLSNLETTKEKILQIVLSGQPELEEKLRRPNLRQLRQRIGVRATLKPMRADEIRAYVETRLRTAGGQKAELFTSAALMRCWQAAQGIPRVINVICDNAMMIAFAEGKDRITTSLMNAAIRDLDGQTQTQAWMMRVREVLSRPAVRYGAVTAVVLLTAYAAGRLWGGMRTDAAAPVEVASVPPPAAPAPQPASAPATPPAPAPVPAPVAATPPAAATAPAPAPVAAMPPAAAPVVTAPNASPPPATPPIVDAAAAAPAPAPVAEPEPSRTAPAPADAALVMADRVRAAMPPTGAERRSAPSVPEAPSAVATADSQPIDAYVPEVSGDSGGQDTASAEPRSLTDVMSGTVRNAEERARRAASRLYGGSDADPGARRPPTAASAAAEAAEDIGGEEAAVRPREDAEAMAQAALKPKGATPPVAAPAPAVPAAAAAEAAKPLPPEDLGVASPPTSPPAGLAQGLESVASLSGTRPGSRPPRAAGTARPVIGRHVKVARGDTVWAIAMQYYGTVDSSVLTEIFRHNAGISDAHELSVGTDVFLPFLSPEQMVAPASGGGYQVLVAESTDGKSTERAAAWATAALPGRELKTVTRGKGTPVKTIYVTGFPSRDSALEAARYLLGRSSRSSLERTPDRLVEPRGRG